jgi:acyl carrier protein
VLASLRQKPDQGSESALLLDTLGQLWLAGMAVGWSGFSAREQRQRIPLPTYPFQRQRYWIEPLQQAYTVDAHQALLQTIEHHMLPPPNRAEPELTAAFVAPRTPVEALIAEVWQEVLGVDRVGVYDDFFALGGHSLFATQIIARLRQALQIELPMHSLFETPTVAGLTDSIIQSQTDQAVP